MGFSVWHCVCCHHTTSVCTHWLECVFASVHVWMSTWLRISPQTPMHSYMETWILLYGTVFVSQSTHLCSQTLFRMCTCISPCTSLSIVMWNHRCPFVVLCMCPNHLIFASVHVFMSTLFSMSAPPPMHSYMETWVSQCGTVCIAVIPLLFPHLV